jgi:hypothetical protein
MVDALLYKGVRRLHVHHLGRARIADAADIANEEDGLFIDAQALIVDAVVVILRAFKDDGLRLVHRP